MSNEDRAERGAQMLEAYRDIRGETDMLETDATDAVADLLHFLRKQGASTTRVITSAEMHFNEERHGTYED